MFGIKKYTTLKSSGYVSVTGPLENREADTQQCCHCGKHWELNPGSGIDRGFCMCCNQLTCGGPGCDTCTPYDSLL